VRTAEDRDRQTLVIVTALLRFCGVVAFSWLLLAGIELTIGIDDDLGSQLLLVSAFVGAAVGVGYLVRSGR
jgi:hypothetical protein